MRCHQILLSVVAVATIGLLPAAIANSATGGEELQEVSGAIRGLGELVSGDTLSFRETDQFEVLHERAVRAGRARMRALVKNRMLTVLESLAGTSDPAVRARLLLDLEEALTAFKGQPGTAAEVVLDETSRSQLRRATRRLDNALAAALRSTELPNPVRLPPGLALTPCQFEGNTIYVTDASLTGETVLAASEAVGEEYDAQSPPSRAAIQRAARRYTTTAAVGFTLEETRSVVAILSEATGLPLDLPTLAQASSCAPADAAVWTRTAWAKVAEHANLLAYYGVSMATVADRGGVLGDAEVVSEVPYARNDRVRIFAVASSEAVRDAWLRRLRKEVSP